MGIAVVGGIIVGWLIRPFCYYEYENQYFTDVATCELEHDVKEQLKYFDKEESVMYGTYDVYPTGVKIKTNQMHPTS